MKLLKKGADGLPKDGFDWITLDVIFKGSKGQKMSNLGSLLLFGNFLKTGLITFGDDIDQLSRDGFDWIIQKVTFKVKKGQVGPFSRN